MKNPLLKTRGYSHIVFLSCINEPRNKLEITRDWGLSTNSKPLHQKKTTRDIDKIEELRLLKKDKSKYYTTFEGFGKLLTKHLESGKKSKNNTFGIVFKAIKENSKNIEQFFQKEWVRKEILSLKNIQKAYDKGSPRETVKLVRNNFFHIFLVIISSYVILRFEEIVKDKGFKSMVNVSGIIDFLKSVIKEGYKVDFDIVFNVCKEAFSKHTEEETQELNNVYDYVQKNMTSVL